MRFLSLIIFPRAASFSVTINEWLGSSECPALEAVNYRAFCMFDHIFPNFLGLIRKDKIIFKSFLPLRVTEIKANLGLTSLDANLPKFFLWAVKGKGSLQSSLVQISKMDILTCAEALEEKLFATALGVRWCECLLWCFIKCPLDNVRKGKQLANIKERLKLNSLLRNTGGFSNQAVFDGATGNFSICPYFMEAGKWEELILVKESKGLQIQFSFAGSCMKLGKSLFLS